MKDLKTRKKAIRDHSPVLIGNSFPLGLVKRKISLEPLAIEELAKRLGIASEIFSFWGHEDTLATASELAGRDLTPRSVRPVLKISDGYPELHGETFRECFVLCPSNRSGTRPDIGKPTSAEDVRSWQSLLLTWPDDES